MQTYRPISVANRALLRFTSVALITTMIAGCGFSGSTQSQENKNQRSASSAQTLWISGVDYVKLISQDGSQTPPNDHPSQFSPAEIESMFAVLHVRKSTDSQKSIHTANFKVVPVFNRKERAKISQLIANGLSLAGPRQDIAFSVSSIREAWFAKRTLSTTGRVFVHNGQLNIIIRELHQAYEHVYKPTTHPTGGYISDTDKRRNPLLPGSRTQTIPHKWSLHPAPGVIIDPPRNQRNDWAAIHPPSGAAASSETAQPDVEAPPADTDMENEGKANPIEDSPPTTDTRPAAAHADSTTKADIKQRLIELKDLYDNGLLPESIYHEEVKKTLSKHYK